jgi:hypothetical protein
LGKSARQNEQLVGGQRRRRAGASLSRTGRTPPKAIPYEAAVSRGYRFPEVPATPKQLNALKRLMLDYLRTHIAKEFPELTTELLGEFMGLSERQAKTVIKDARAVDGSALAKLVIELLYGMHTGDVAGILGTPKRQDIRYFFRAVYEFDIEFFLDDVPEWLREISLIPVPADATSLFEYQGTVRINDATGKHDRDAVILAKSEDGTNWIEDPSAPKNWATFSMWHAAFRLAFREWLRKN